jgi:2-succinyl-6-hydroxy-2,4-cyclohexadiene-1-carboxylate synthase
LARTERIFDSGEGTPALVLLHGFTGSADAWRDLLPHLSRRTRTVAFDLPGHAAAPLPGPAPPRIDLDDFTASVRGRLDALGIGRAVLLGYSMGGRVALRFALDHGDRVAGLVLESASPGIADPAERAARHEADDALADAIVRDGLGRFVDRWMAQPLFATQARLPEAVREHERAMRLARDPRALAACLRGAGPGRATPMWDALPALGMPVLLLAGELDAKYRDIAAKAAARLPRARIAIVPNAGHATHLENPAAFTAAVEAFLIELQGGK